MKATEQYFPVVLFIMLYKVVLTFKSVDEILWCYYSHETSPTELFSNSCSALYKQKIKFFFHCKLGLKRLMQRLSSKIITSKLKTWSLSVPKHAGSNGYPFLGPIDINSVLPREREFGFRNTGHCCSWNPESESWALESGKQLRKFESPNDWNPESNSSENDWKPERGIRNPRLGVHNPNLSWISLHGAKWRNGKYTMISKNFRRVFKSLSILF